MSDSVVQVAEKVNGFLVRADILSHASRPLDENGGFPVNCLSCNNARHTD